MTPLVSLSTLKAALALRTALSLALTAAPDAGSAAALGTPKDAPGPAPCAELSRPHPDSAVLRSLVGAFESSPVEIRIIAIENLGLLRDARAIDPLAALALDPEPRVATAALRSVGRFQHERAEEVLANVVRHPRLPDSLKLIALEQLVFQRRPSARAFLDETGKSRAPSVAIQNAAREAAQRWGPAPAPAARSTP